MRTQPAGKEHRTVSRVMGILEEAAKSPHGVRLNTLALELQAPKSSLHALAKGLVALGYLTETNGTYFVGPAVGTLLSRAPASVEEAARPLLAELRDQFDESVMLSRFVGDGVVYSESFESTQIIRYSVPQRTRRPLYPTSSGKCFLAWSPDGFAERYLDEAIKDSMQRQRALEELQQIRQQRVSINRGEVVPEVSGVAAPIFRGERVVAALAIAGPTSRIVKSIDSIANAVQMTAAELSQHLS